MEEVYEVMKVKSNKKGAFNDKIYLEYVDEDKRNIEQYIKFYLFGFMEHYLCYT